MIYKFPIFDVESLKLESDWFLNSTSLASIVHNFFYDNFFDYYPRFCEALTITVDLFYDIIAEDVIYSEF